MHAEMDHGKTLERNKKEMLKSLYSINALLYSINALITVKSVCLKAVCGSCSETLN